MAGRWAGSAGWVEGELAEQFAGGGVDDPGSGVSVAIPPTQSVVMTAVAPADIGKASGTFNMLRQLGGVFGIAICAAVFAAHGSYASPATFTSGFGPAMGACAGLALAGAIAGLVIPRPRQPLAAQPESGAIRAPETEPAR